MKSYNKYDKYIFLLIVSLVTGSFGGSLQIPRLLAILFMPAMLKVRGQCRFYTTKLRQIIIAFIVFAAFSLVWTPDFINGVKHVVYFVVHFLLFFEILIFSRMAKDPIKSIVAGWLVFIICCSLISVWELFTDQHLSLSKQESDSVYNMGGGEIIARRFTAVTFYNYNGYNTVLCFAVPWAFYGLISANNLRQRILCISCVLLPLIFILFNASRGALLSLAIYFIIYVIFCPSRKVKIFSVVAFVAILYYAITELSDLLVLITARASNLGMFSDNARFSIWGNALKAYFDTFGIGTGAGGLQIAMEKYAKGDISITHNMLLELLVQYGFVFAGIFIVFLLKLFRKSIHLRDKNRRMALLMVFCAFPLYTIIDSGYLQSVPLFAFFASVYIFANLDIIKTCHNEQVGSSN